MTVPDHHSNTDELSISPVVTSSMAVPSAGEPHKRCQNTLNKYGSVVSPVLQLSCMKKSASAALMNGLL